MINYIEIQDDLKNLSDDQVKQVAVNPANPMHGTLAVAELDRRNRMRTDQMARQASPMTTIAEQLVTGAPNVPAGQPGMGAQGAGPAPPSPMGQAPAGMPVGPGMAHGGSVDNLRGLAALMRIPELESLTGAMGAARGLMGEDPYANLRAMIERYREGAGDRERMDITQLLMRIGSGLMNSRRPDYLGALGEGAAGAVEGVDNMVERRNAEERQGIEDEGAMARLLTERQGQELDLGGRLFSAGRGGLEQAADIEGALLNNQTQRDIANIYASRPRGGVGAGGSDLVTLRALYNRASINLNSARSQLNQMLRAGMDEQDPSVQRQMALVQQLEREAEDALLSVQDALSGGGLGALEALGEVDVGADLGAVYNNAAPNTNAPNIRTGARTGGPSNPIEFYARYAQALPAAVRAVESARARGASDEEARAAGSRAFNNVMNPEAESTLGINPGSYEDYVRQHQDTYRQDLGDYSVRRE